MLLPSIVGAVIPEEFAVQNVSFAAIPEEIYLTNVAAKHQPFDHYVSLSIWDEWKRVYAN